MEQGCSYKFMNYIRMVIIILNHCVAEMNINLTLYLLRFQDNISGNYDAFEDSKFKGTILVNIKLLGDLISNLYFKKNIYIYGSLSLVPLLLPNSNSNVKGNQQSIC